MMSTSAPTSEPSVSIEPGTDLERKLLLTRINHLDGQATAIRAVGLPVFITAFGACAGLKLGLISAGRVAPYRIEFLLPVAIAVSFFLIEVRVRSKHELCKDRWDALLGRPPPRAARHKLLQWQSAFDWIDRHRGSLRSGIHRDLLVIYGAMFLLAAAFWVL